MRISYPRSNPRSIKGIFIAHNRNYATFIFLSAHHLSAITMSTSSLGKESSPLTTVSPQSQCHLRIIVDNIRDADRRHYLQKIRCDPLEQPSQTPPPHRLHGHIPHAIIRRRMNRRALTLQSRPQQIERIDGASAESTAERADACREEIIEGDIFNVAAFYSGFAGCDEVLEILEGGEVDGAVGEHADEAHGQAAVK